MERLTVPAKKLDDGRTVMPIIDGRVVREHAMDFYWRLKEYEDLEEQGLLLRLPCKVGETVWESDEHLEVCLTECKVDRFAFDNAGELYCIYSAKNGMFSAKRYIEEFGKTLFLTKAEAEKKLAEMGE